MPKTNKNKFNEKYKQPLNQPNSKKDISKLTGIPMSILDDVYDRGLAAHKNNPQSVRNIKGIKGGSGKKMSAAQWAISRIYSFVVKGPTWRTADKDLADKVRKKKIPGYIR
tara:strand:- start:932 stop:1264 length:333 start_codon:yes stop_codon:yes gene_type:complete